MSEVAGVEPKIAEQDDEGAAIVVNGQLKQVPSREVSWVEVVELAFPGDRTNPDLQFIVTYEEAAEQKDDGTLGDTNSVRVREKGTVFHVKKHRRS